MTIPEGTDRPGATARAWVLRTGAFLAAGAASAVPVRAVLSWLSVEPSSLRSIVVGSALVVPLVAVPAWALLLGDARTGPWWGGLVGAWVPAALAAAVAVLAWATGDLSPGTLGVLTAALYLAATPLTAVLAAVGAFLEVVLPRSTDF